MCAPAVGSEMRYRGGVGGRCKESTVGGDDEKGKEGELGQSRTFYPRDEKTVMRTVIGWQRPYSKMGRARAQGTRGSWEKMGNPEYCAGGRGDGDGEPEEQRRPSGGCAASASLLVGLSAGLLQACLRYCSVSLPSDQARIGALPRLAGTGDGDRQDEATCSIAPASSWAG
jgi:hypothetical protein